MMSSTRRSSVDDEDDVIVIHSDDEGIQDDADDLAPLLLSDGQSDVLQDQPSASTSSAVMSAKLSKQYIAAFCATLGAFSMGTVIGYSSPAGAILSNYTNPLLNLTDAELSWFSSTSNLGALVGSPTGGYFINFIGRRGTMFALIIPFLVGWTLLAAAQNFAMLILGRFVTGICCGVVSVAVPTYIGEFASPQIRGQLGSGFQLNVVIGVLFAYCMGAAFDDFRWIACVCIIFPCLFFLSMIPNKESPSYLLAKGQENRAKQSLQYFRGNDYNISSEIETLKTNLERDQNNKISLRDLKAPYILKPLSIALGTMFFQQVSGINAVLFNLQTIFSDAGTTFGDDLASIIVGIMQVVATFAALILMDKAGRKILLLISSAFMAISLAALGVFFYLKEQAEASENLDDVQQVIDNLGWLPLVCLIVFIVAFSIGYGPVPWLFIGEVFTSNVREVAGSLVSMTNWTLAFIITLSFNPLKSAINDSGSYWFFAAFNVASFIFVLLFIYETKGKSLEEISAHFGAPSTATKSKREED